MSDDLAVLQPEVPAVEPAPATSEPAGVTPVHSGQGRSRGGLSPLAGWLLVAIAAIGLLASTARTAGPDEVFQQTTAWYLSEHVLQPDGTPEFSVPAELVDGPCYAHDQTKSAGCMPPRSQGMGIYSAILNYPPPYFWVVGGGELLLELREIAERALDRVGERARRLTAVRLVHQRPEQRVVPVSAAVVAHGGSDGVRDLRHVAAEVVERPAREFGRLLDRGIQVVDVRLMMLAVVDLHRLRIDVRLERVGSVGKGRKCMRHVFLQWVLFQYSRTAPASQACFVRPDLSHVTIGGEIESRTTTATNPSM